MPNQTTIGVAVLAGGRGKRLKTNTPKPLAPLAGRRLIDYPICVAQQFFHQAKIPGQIGVVVGHRGEQVKEHLAKHFDALHFAVQNKPLGTADALKAYFRDCPWAKKKRLTLVLCADTPLLTPPDLITLQNQLTEHRLEAAVATFKATDPRGYGRIVPANPGFRIVEQKETTPREASIDEVNSGLYLMETDFVLSALDAVGADNKAREFYLTDLFANNPRVRTVLFENEDGFLGVNTLAHLEAAARTLGQLKSRALREEGVRFIDSRHCYIDHDVSIESGTVVYPHCHLQGDTSIGKNCLLGPGVVLQDCRIEDGVEIKAYSHLEKTVVKSRAKVGPFARLREGSVIGQNAKVGNFVETKKTSLGDHSAVSHLSYVGDAEIGEHSNLGCGFITCNYDGADKLKTKIGDRAFIGSDTQVIAPVSIGDSTYVASGSTINRDLPDGAFAISRCRQTTREGAAQRFLKGKWAE